MSGEWLEAHLGRPGLVVVESDEDVLLYETGHIQGAVVYEGQRNGDLRTAIRSIVGDFPAYTTADLSVGVKTARWSAERHHLHVTAYDDGVVLVTLDLPERRNAMSDVMTAAWPEVTWRSAKPRKSG